VTGRERATFARLVDRVCAPVPPLPPVAETDAVDAFEAWMDQAPKLNRALARAALLTLGDRVIALEALRAAAAFSYYGDHRVSAILGYNPQPSARHLVEG
jgi:hypothetical protein